MFKRVIVAKEGTWVGLVEVCHYHPLNPKRRSHFDDLSSDNGIELGFKNGQVIHIYEEQPWMFFLITFVDMIIFLIARFEPVLNHGYVYSQMML